MEKAGTVRSTTAVLKNLTVPGLDVRLAFGRVRDEVLRSTARPVRLYGSLGGGNIALVPAPRQVAPEAAANDIKADYELVQKIGTKRAWEVFLGTAPDRLLRRSRARPDRGAGP